ncbi:two-component system C4-dicarboxylate transport sensor histidine kinase DctB [Chitinivorax tropicus]|uniref:C4-dicarboxylate transport sensor protein DctB n=1 Tax=Chitinivorax tropicus TaxID=714531 RepID=A0A840MNZ7_9PROT|nr:ATP-binding protein [Chitinivorax tropicus]MBB5018727.1 two-component system C4-dicarboxylate transport sensor histidine kinase DctB [Chitinivorax tropicus]
MLNLMIPPRHRPLAGLLILLSLAVLTLTMHWAEQAELSRLREAGNHRLEIYAGSLRSTISRYSYLPRVLALNQDVRDLLLHPADTHLQRRANRYLETINQEAGSATLFVLDLNGTAIASSNWSAAGSYIGNNYGFRPYFQQARQSRPGHFYAIGTTTGQAGYFLSLPIYQQRSLLGIAVVKINLETLESSWRSSTEQVLVADANHIVFLSSAPHLKMHALHPVTDLAAQSILRSRQYTTTHFPPLPVQPSPQRDSISQQWRLVDDHGRTRHYLAQRQALTDLDWQMWLLTDAASARHARQLALLAGVPSLAALYFGLFAYLQRRCRIRDNLAAKALLEQANNALEQKVIARTHDLQQMNHALSAEIRERQHAESELRAAQHELVQAAKLAALGQMAAGITHELNQPLAAMRTLTDNAQTLLSRNQIEAARGNLGLIANLIDRMGRITSQLRSFARRGDAPQQVSLYAALSGALSLLDQRIRQQQVTIDMALPADRYEVWFEPIKLEQILINILRNALDALYNQLESHIIIRAQLQHDQITLTILDDGPGIHPDHLPRLFDPFFSTKRDPDSMGLGLAISLATAREFGADLSAHNHPAGGACFVLTLKAVTESVTHEA